MSFGLFKKGITNIVLGFIAIFLSISHCPTIWPGFVQLSDNAKSNCILFKLQNGSTRISECCQIVQELVTKYELIPASKDPPANTIWRTNTLTQYDVIKMLGIPKKLEQNALTYYLDADNKSTVTIIINQ